MRLLIARVQNGRLVLNEPTDLPEGEVVELVTVDDVVANGGDTLDDEDRAALNRELEASFAEEAAGQLFDVAEAMAVLRADSAMTCRAVDDLDDGDHGNPG